MTEATIASAARAVYDDCLPLPSIPLDYAPPARWRVKTFAASTMADDFAPSYIAELVAQSADEWLQEQDYYAIVRVGDLRLSDNSGHASATLTVVYTELTVGKDGAA